MRRISCAALAAALLVVLPGSASAALTDGQWALIDRKGSGDRLITMNPPSDGGEVGQRTLHTAPVGVRLEAPQWSPDGNRIVFVEGARVLLYDLATAKLSEVAPEGAAPAWSPDGARIAFVRGAALLTRAPDGSGEQTLPVDATRVLDVSWLPGGGAFALWVDGHRLELVGADGSGREIVDDRARGGAAWSPDGSRVVYPRQLEGTDVVTLWEVTEEDERAIGISGAAADPEFSPSGRTVVYTRSDARDGQRVIAWLTGEQHSSTRPPDVLPVHVDWQPCVPGVTVSCTSVTPPLSLPVRKLTCSPSPYVVHVTSGRDTPIRLRCSGARGYEIVTPPAHGTATGGASLTYRAAAGYVGPDTFSYRALAADGRVSDPIRVQLNVIAPRVKPAAPRLTLAPETLKLNRRGRVTVRGTCDRVCTVKLRVRVKLKTGRLVDGRAVVARAAAGGPVTLVLRRAKLPARRKVASMRVSGTATGADGRVREVRVTLR